MLKKYSVLIIGAAIFFAPLSAAPARQQTKLVLTPLADFQHDENDRDFIGRYWNVLRERAAHGQRVQHKSGKYSYTPYPEDRTFQQVHKDLCALLDRLYCCLVIKDGNQLFLIRRPDHFLAKPDGKLARVMKYLERVRYASLQDLEQRGFKLQVFSKFSPESSADQAIQTSSDEITKALQDGYNQVSDSYTEEPKILTTRSTRSGELRAAAQELEKLKELSSDEESEYEYNRSSLLEAFGLRVQKEHKQDNDQDEQDEEDGEQDGDQENPEEREMNEKMGWAGKDFTAQSTQKMQEAMARASVEERESADANE